MIDIIISVYNAHDTIEKTLYSIGLQANKKIINVYIVNNDSKKDYEEICCKFSNFFNIKELKINTNKGTGYAKQYAINHSNGKYIIFLESGDILYDCYTTSNLYYEIEYNKLDMCIGEVYLDNKNNLLSNTNNLHGKIFRRSYLEESDIKFLNANSDENIIFTYMAKLCTNTIKNIKLPVCVCKCNSTISENSIYVKNLKELTKNSCELISFIKEKNIDFKKSSLVLANILICLYYKYNDISDINSIKYLYKVGKEFFESVSEEEWVEIYNNYYTNIIAKISFFDFIQLIK